MGKHQDLYNFEIRSASEDETTGYLPDIMSNQQNPFKFNASLGFILQNFLTRQIVYYYASTNNRLFAKPIMIRRKFDTNKFFEQLRNVDLLEHCRQQRPNSRFTVRKITNILFYVEKIKSHTIGCPCKLPDYIAKKQSIISFTHDRKYSAQYVDHLCFFRCLAYHQLNSYSDFEQTVSALFSKFLSNRGE